VKLLKRFTLDRRTMLRGMLGGASVAIGLPMLEAMMSSHGTALAGGEAFPRRFVLWFFGNGVILPRWIPAAQGTGWECSEELAPLADVQSYVSVLSGFNNRTQGRRGHHDGQAGMCSGIPFIEIEAQGGAPYASKFGGPSIDQVIVNNLMAPTLIPSLEIGVSKRNLHGSCRSSTRRRSTTGSSATSFRPTIPRSCSASARSTSSAATSLGCRTR
jgi:hypothetical protein